MKRAVLTVKLQGSWFVVIFLIEVPVGSVFVFLIFVGSWCRYINCTCVLWVV